MLDPQHCLQALLWRLCSQMLDPAWLAPASSAVVLADARLAALLAPASYAVVIADARPAALLAPAPLAVVLADA